MEYPKTVVINDNKILNLLKEKEDLIIDGREISQQIEDMEQEMAKIDTAIQEIEKNVDTSAVKARADEVTAKFNAVAEEMDAVKKATFEIIKSAVPLELVDKYEKIKKDKEELENKRNKIGLKVQQKNDKIIPMGQKLMEPFLEDEYEDYDTLRVENGEVVGTIFSHLNDFKVRFKKNKK